MEEAKKIFEKALNKLDNQDLKEQLRLIAWRGVYRNQLAKKNREALERCFKEELYSGEILKNEEDKKEKYILVTIDKDCKYLPTPFWIDFDYVFRQDYEEKGSVASLPKK